MSRYFNIKLTGGTSSGPYSVYYDSIISGSLATLYPSGLPASGITLADLTSPLGVGIQVPDNALTIILYNEKCDTYQVFDIGPDTEDIICFCLTIVPIAGQPDEVINQILFCPTGLYTDGHPVYEGTFGGETYSLTWSDSKKYWQVNGLPFINGPIRSYDSSNIPLTGWEVFGECSNDYMIIADEGECPDPLTIYFINCDQTNPTCLNINNGTIVSHAIGGVGGWLYSLDGINYDNPLGIFTDLYVGSYTIYAMDSGGTMTSCSVLLQAPPSTSYPLVIGVTTQDRFISTSLGFKYYRLDYEIDTSGLPNGISITFDFVLTYLLNYIQPGTAYFNTTSSTIRKNGNIIPLSVVTSQSLTQNGQSTCNATYGNFDGIHKVSATNITVENTDVIDGYIVYGIDTDTSGQYVDSCLTKAKVNVIVTLENAKTNTVCDNVSVVSLNYNRIQTYSGQSIVTVTNTTNSDGGQTGSGTTTTTTSIVVPSNTYKGRWQWENWAGFDVYQFEAVVTKAYINGIEVGSCPGYSWPLNGTGNSGGNISNITCIPPLDVLGAQIPYNTPTSIKLEFSWGQNTGYNNYQVRVDINSSWSAYPFSYGMPSITLPPLNILPNDQVTITVQ